MDQLQTPKKPKVVARPAGQKIFVPAPPKIKMPRPASAGLSPREALLQSLYDAVVITDNEDRILEANMRAETLLGFTPEELNRIGMDRVFPDTDLRQLRQRATDQSYGLGQGACRCKDGSSIHMEIAVSSISCEEHPGFCYSLRDITQRRQTEARLLTVYNAIAQTANGIVITDADHRITFANAAFAAMLGQHDVSGLNDADMVDFLPDREILRQIDEHIRDGHACSLQTNLTTPAGALLPVQILASPDTTQAGALTGIVFSFEDTTERQHIEEMQRQARERQIETERIQARVETITTLGYAINNPLQAMLSMVELEKRDDYRNQIERIMNILSELHQDKPLPRSVTEDGQACFAIQQEQAQKQEQQACRPHTLLLADDEDMIRKLFLRIIAATFPALQIEAAANGRLALEAFKQKHHQIVILDVAMPEMDGIQAGQAIIRHCSEQAWTTPNLIFCSGFMPSPELVEIAGDSAHHAILKKPIKSSILLETLKKFIPSPPTA